MNMNSDYVQSCDTHVILSAIWIKKNIDLNITIIYIHFILLSYTLK